MAQEYETYRGLMALIHLLEDKGVFTEEEFLNKLGEVNDPVRVFDTKIKELLKSENE